MVGSALASMLVAMFVLVTSTVGASPTTVSVSLTSPVGSVTSTVSVRAAVTVRPLRATLRNPDNSNDTVYSPSGSEGKLYAPPASVTLMPASGSVRVAASAALCSALAIVNPAGGATVSGHLLPNLPTAQDAASSAMHEASAFIRAGWDNLNGGDAEAAADAFRRAAQLSPQNAEARSEERRVGKECECWWATEEENK